MSLLGAQHIAAKMAFEILKHNSTHTHTISVDIIQIQMEENLEEKTFTINKNFTTYLFETIRISDV